MTDPCTGALISPLHQLLGPGPLVVPLFGKLVLTYAHRRKYRAGISLVSLYPDRPRARKMSPGSVGGAKMWGHRRYCSPERLVTSGRCWEFCLASPAKSSARPRPNLGDSELASRTAESESTKPTRHRERLAIHGSEMSVAKLRRPTRYDLMKGYTSTVNGCWTMIAPSATRSSADLECVWTLV